MKRVRTDNTLNGTPVRYYFLCSELKLSGSNMAPSQGVQADNED